MSIRLAVVDISGAYIQSGPIRTDIYVRPLREFQNTKRGSIWKHLKFPYRVVEAGRQWAKFIEVFLINYMVMEQAKGISQLLVKRLKYGSVAMFLSKFSDYELTAAELQNIKDFIDKITG